MLIDFNRFILELLVWWSGFLGPRNGFIALTKIEGDNFNEILNINLPRTQVVVSILNSM